MTATNPAPIPSELTATAGANRVLLIGGDSELSKSLDTALVAQSCLVDRAAGCADALCRLRQASYEVVITDPSTPIEEDLALLSEMRRIRPGVRVIILASSTTPEDVIAALRARVFALKSAPFNPTEIAQCAAEAATDRDSLQGIQILSARPDWVSVQVNCQMLSADRLVSFLKELQSELPPSPREDLMMAFREILMNAMEHGAKFQPQKVVEVSAIHTARAIVFYVHDPGSGFHWDAIPHAAVSNPLDNPAKHVELRESQGMRPGGFGILVAQGIVDELIYSEVGNEVLLIKHTA